MRIRTLLLPVCVLACTVSLGALQNALAPAGWGPDEVNQIAQGFFTSSSADVTSFLGWLSQPARNSLRARNGASRAQIARELALYAKRFVQAPGFEKTHTAWIRESLNAVNHGLKVGPEEDRPVPAEGSQHGQIAAALSEALKSTPVEGFRMMLDSEAGSLARSRNPADAQKLTRVRHMQSLLPARAAEAQKLYIAYMVAKMGGPADGAGVEAAMQQASRDDAEQKRREQQRNYDKYNLRAQLRGRLNAFLAEARSVDFAARTRQQAGRLVFENPEYESKKASWKLLYRIGREPVMAAVEVAEQWRREL